MTETTNESFALHTSLELSKDEKDLLGTTDLGFDEQKMYQLLNEYRLLTVQNEEEQKLREDEKQKLRRELGYVEGGRLRRLSVINSHQNQSLNSQEIIQKQKRLQELEWSGSAISETQIKLDEIAQLIRSESYKRSDQNDIRDIWQEIISSETNIQPRLPSNTDRKIISQKDTPPFTIKTTIEGTKKSEQISDEVWFHTTKFKHLLEMIAMGGLVNQTWLKNHNPDYYEKISSNLALLTEGGSGSVDKEMLSPFNETDSDKIYFRAERTEAYGSAIIAFNPLLTFGGSRLFFYPQGHQHDMERVISDVANLELDSLGNNRESELQISLDTAIIATKKEEYRPLVRALMQSGYDVEWIKMHTFSYRNNDAGVKAAEKEIKKRFKEFSQNVPRLRIAPNPKAADGLEKVYQFF